jgi:hypothetical protein
MPQPMLPIGLASHRAGGFSDLASGPPRSRNASADSTMLAGRVTGQPSHIKGRDPWIVSGALLLPFLGRDPDFGGAIRWHSQKPPSPPQNKRTATCSATLTVTIVPSGSATTKNCFIGPATLDCSTRSCVMEESSLNQIRCRTRGIATTIAATIMEKRIKTI